MLSRHAIQRAAAAGLLVAAAMSALPAAAPWISAIASSLVGARLYVDADSRARQQADAWRSSRPADAAFMDRIASQPTATWFGSWNGDIRRDVDALAGRGARDGSVPVMVAYNIPDRDCGSYSAGGARDAGAYQRWIRQFAAGLGGRRALVVLEPDAVAQSDCQVGDARGERLSLLRDAVSVLKEAGAAVYLDAGHAGWISPAAMAARLRNAGIAGADGFALNVSNFIGTPANAAYGDALSRLLGGAHYVIDTGRNGRGGPANGEWCNAPEQSLGMLPTTRTGKPLIDAYLWIKTPGESDGSCNGGPPAGKWWPDYALTLARNAAN